MVSAIADSGKVVIGHNIKFDIKFLYKETAILLTEIWDTQIAQMVLTAGKYPRQRFFSLKELVQDCCDIILDKDIRLEFIVSDIVTEEMLIYAVRDVQYLKKIYAFQIGEGKNVGMSNVLELEMKLAPVVTLLDWDAWMVLADEAKEKTEELQPKIVEELIDRTWDIVKDYIKDGVDAYKAYDIPVPKAQDSRTGKIDLTLLESLTNEVFLIKQLKNEFNIGSHKQLKRGLQLCGFTVDGEPIPNTQAATLELFSEDSLISNILNYREADKRVTTYGENWKEYIHEQTGRIHPQFNQVGTVTGRWSSDSPNLQNVPNEASYRHCFIARKGYKLVTADYSQAELRFVGAVSFEEEIIKAYKAGEDIHARTASIIFDKPIEEVTPEERSRGKTLNFSILYGSTAYGISQKNPDISETEADDLLDKFIKGYPKLAKCIKDTSNQIWRTKLSKTPMGRIRYFTVDDSRLWNEKELRKQMGAIKREGFNHIIQGGSADSLKIAMVYAFHNSPFDHDDFRFQLQVHDEVVVEIAEAILDEGIAFLIDAMEKAEQIFIGDIPAKADYHVADYWSKD